MKLETRAALSPTPVFRDGLSTTLSYVILAVKDNVDVYNCVCLSNHRTMKFYPNLEFWGLTQEQVNAMDIPGFYTRPRHGYEGFHGITSGNVEKLMEVINKQRGVAAVPTSKIAGVFETPQQVRLDNVVLHPFRGGGTPHAYPELPANRTLRLAHQPSEEYAEPEGA